MKKIVFSLLALLFAFQPTHAADEVSLVALLADPHSFAGKEVIVDGVVRLSSGDSAIFLSMEASENNVTTLAIGLKLSTEACKILLNRFGNNVYLRIRGTMRAPAADEINLGTVYQLGYLDNVKVLRKIN